jgi:hypothetical protein
VAGGGSADRGRKGRREVETFSTATERVRVVRSVGARYQFTTPGLISAALGATACAITPVLTSGRRELTPRLCATDVSHPFCLQLTVPTRLVADYKVLDTAPSIGGVTC